MDVRRGGLGKDGILVICFCFNIVRIEVGDVWELGVGSLVYIGFLVRYIYYRKRKF